MRKIGNDWKDEVVCCLGTAVHFGVLWEMGLRWWGWEGVDDGGGLGLGTPHCYSESQAAMA